MDRIAAARGTNACFWFDPCWAASLLYFATGISDDDYVKDEPENTEFTGHWLFGIRDGILIFRKVHMQDLILKTLTKPNIWQSSESKNKTSLCWQTFFNYQWTSVAHKEQSVMELKVYACYWEGLPILAVIQIWSVDLEDQFQSYALLRTKSWTTFSMNEKMDVNSWQSVVQAPKRWNKYKTLQAKWYKSTEIIKAKLTFYRRHRQNMLHKIGAESRRLTLSAGNVDRKEIWLPVAVAP